MPSERDAEIEGLRDRVLAASELDDLLCALITAMFIAPAGSFVTVASISSEVRVCVDRKAFTKADDVWTDWPAWRARWKIGTLDAAFGLVERTMTGANFIYGRGRTRVGEPPYGCQLLFGTDDVLGQGEHEDGPCAVVLAVLDALANKRGGHHA